MDNDSINTPQSPPDSPIIVNLGGISGIVGAYYAILRHFLGDSTIQGAIIGAHMIPSILGQLREDRLSVRFWELREERGGLREGFDISQITDSTFTSY